MASEIYSVRCAKNGCSAQASRASLLAGSHQAHSWLKSNERAEKRGKFVKSITFDRSKIHKILGNTLQQIRSIEISVLPILAKEKQK